MINANIDLGQLIVAGMIAVIGYFLKKELTTITARLNKHDQMIIRMFGDINLLLGRGDRSYRDPDIYHGKLKQAKVEDED